MINWDKVKTIGDGFIEVLKNNKDILRTKEYRHNLVRFLVLYFAFIGLGESIVNLWRHPFVMVLLVAAIALVAWFYTIRLHQEGLLPKDEEKGHDGDGQ